VKRQVVSGFYNSCNGEVRRVMHKVVKLESSRLRSLESSKQCFWFRHVEQFCWKGCFTWFVSSYSHIVTHMNT